MEIKPKYVKMGLATTLIVAVLGAVQTVQAQELLNTATNEVYSTHGLAELDMLRELYIELEEQSYETESTFILVKQENGSVTLFNIDYPYEDYAETNLPINEIANYANLTDVLEEL